MSSPSVWRATPAQISLRNSITNEIERLIAVLDLLDGDPDFEPHQDFEPSGDEEPWLGWSTLPNGGVLFGATDDLEEEWT
jgi:hypothetical protein